MSLIIKNNISGLENYNINVIQIENKIQLEYQNQIIKKDLIRFKIDEKLLKKNLN